MEGNEENEKEGLIDDRLLTEIPNNMNNQNGISKSYELF